MNNRIRHHEINIEPPPRPAEHRVPLRRLPFDQARRILGAIAKQVGFGIFGEIRREKSHIWRHPINRRIGQPGQRHRPWINLSDHL